MNSSLIRDVNRDHGFANLTLNQSDRLNSLSNDLLESLAEAIESVSEDDSIRAVIITGSGRVFCTGADTDEMTGGEGEGPHKPGPGCSETLRRGFKLVQKVILGIYEMGKPIISAINRSAVGARYIHAGLFPGYGGTWLYPRLPGSGKAAELMSTGSFMEVDEAKDLGFLNDVVPEEELLDAAEKMARRLTVGPPIAIRLAKTMVWRGMSTDLETSLEMAAAAEAITLSSSDHAEGMSALR